MIALVVAPHGALRDGLAGLLSAMDLISVVSTTNNLDGALRFVLEYCPAVILLDCEELDNVELAKVELIIAACPESKILAFVPSPELSARLEACGVDNVLLYGSKAATIVATISALIQPNDDHAANMKNGKSSC